MDQTPWTLPPPWPQPVPWQLPWPPQSPAWPGLAGPGPALRMVSTDPLMLPPAPRERRPVPIIDPATGREVSLAGAGAGGEGSMEPTNRPVQGEEQGADRRGQPSLSTHGELGVQLDVPMHEQISFLQPSDLDPCSGTLNFDQLMAGGNSAKEPIGNDTGDAPLCSDVQSSDEAVKDLSNLTSHVHDNRTPMSTKAAKNIPADMFTEVKRKKNRKNRTEGNL